MTREFLSIFRKNVPCRTYRYFGFASSAVMQNLMATMIFHFVPFSTFYECAQAANTKTGLPIKFAQLNTR